MSRVCIPCRALTIDYDELRFDIAGVLKLTAKPAINKKAQTCLRFKATTQQVWVPLVQTAGRLKSTSINLAGIRIGGAQLQLFAVKEL